MGGKVLIIDDDPALLRLMSMAFQRAGYGVVAADNGRKGILCLAQPVNTLGALFGLVGPAAVPNPGMAVSIVTTRRGAMRNMTRTSPGWWYG